MLDAYLSGGDFEANSSGSPDFGPASCSASGSALAVETPAPRWGLGGCSPGPLPRASVWLPAITSQPIPFLSSSALSTWAPSVANNGSLVVQHAVKRPFQCCKLRGHSVLGTRPHQDLQSCGQMSRDTAKLSCLSPWVPRMAPKTLHVSCSAPSPCPFCSPLRLLRRRGWTTVTDESTLDVRVNFF